MTFAEFRLAAQEHFQTLDDFKDVAKQGWGMHYPAYSALIRYQDVPVTLHVRQPIPDHWNAWITVLNLPTVVGAVSGRKAVQDLAAKLSAHTSRKGSP